MSKLFTPVRAGALSLGHRVVMAPLTRMRADPGDRPSALMKEYYTQRSSEGGLIISEATPISRQGYGYAGAPGIYDDAQIDGWRAITDAVHALAAGSHCNSGMSGGNRIPTFSRAVEPRSPLPRSRPKDMAIRHTGKSPSRYPVRWSAPR